MRQGQRNKNSTRSAMTAGRCWHSRSTASRRKAARAVPTIDRHGALLEEAEAHACGVHVPAPRGVTAHVDHHARDRLRASTTGADSSGGCSDRARACSKLAQLAEGDGQGDEHTPERRRPGRASSRSAAVTSAARRRRRARPARWRSSPSTTSTSRAASTTSVARATTGVRTAASSIIRHRPQRRRDLALFFHAEIGGLADQGLQHLAHLARRFSSERSRTTRSRAPCGIAASFANWRSTYVVRSSRRLTIHGARCWRSAKAHAAASRSRRAGPPALPARTAEPRSRGRPPSA
jgi:hypothetical protein